jgi:hypothetical protein
MPSFSIHQPIGFRLLVAGLLLKVVFDTCYIHFVSPTFDYYGLTLSVNPSKLIESYLLTSAILIALGLRQRTPSTMIFIVNTFLAVSPILSIYALQDRSSEFAYGVIVTFIISIFFASLPRIQVLRFKMSPRMLVVISAGAALVVLLAILGKGGLANFNLNLNEVYEYRDATSALAYTGVLAYLTHWVTAAFNVALLVWGLYRKNWPIVFAATAMQVFLFGLTSHRATLFNLPFVAVLYFLIKRNHDVVAAGWAISLLLGIGMLESLFLGGGQIISLIGQRVFALPAFLAFEYQELFGNIGYVYWTDSYAGWFWPYPFAMEPPNLVGKYTLGSEHIFANNGMFGSGYMHAGLMGMFLYGLVYGLWMYLIDCIAVGRVPLHVAVALLILPVLNIATDVDLKTGLLTHGGFVATFMLWLWAGAFEPSRRVPRRAIGPLADVARRG